MTTKQVTERSLRRSVFLFQALALFGDYLRCGAHDAEPALFCPAAGRGYLYCQFAGAQALKGRTVSVYYCDLFAFDRNDYDFSAWFHIRLQADYLDSGGFVCIFELSCHALYPEAGQADVLYFGLAVLLFVATLAVGRGDQRRTQLDYRRSDIDTADRDSKILLVLFIASFVAIISLEDCGSRIFRRKLSAFGLVIF